MTKFPKTRYDNNFRCNYSEHRVLKFSVDAEVDKIDSSTIQFEFSTEHSLDMQKSSVLIVQGISAYRISESGIVPIRTPVAELTTESTFVFKDFNSRLTGKESVGLDPFILSVITALSYSTNRGIFLTKCAGTPLATIPLQIIDPYILANFEKPPVMPERVKPVPEGEAIAVN